ncbi:phage protein [Staphylococcus schweitzeri]|nr:phage protein [Staphylococcus schweitzeri]
MNNREQIEQSVISASAYNGNDTEGLLKEIEDVYKYKDMWEKLKKDYLETYIRYRNAKNRNIIGEQHILSFIYAMDLFDGNKDAENVLEKLESEE